MKEETFAGFSWAADPEGEFDFGGGTGKVGHGMLVIFDALASAVGGGVFVVEGGAGVVFGSKR